MGESVVLRNGTVRVGDRFRSRRNRAMVVTVTHLFTGEGVEPSAAVRRTTSRRCQAILCRRLLNGSYYEKVA